MGRRRREPNWSRGTVAVFALTLLVVAACGAFVIRIGGINVDMRALVSFVTDEETDAEPLDLFSGAQATPEPVFAQDRISPAPTPTPTPMPPREPVTLRIAAAGTIYAPRIIQNSAKEGSGYDFLPLLRGVETALEGADLTLATLETTISGKEAGYSNGNAPAELLDALRMTGIDLLSLATERALDRGSVGLFVTQSEIASRGLGSVGVGREPAVYSINGVQVAVLAYTYGLSEDGQTQIAKDAQISEDTMARLELSLMQEDIRKARAQGAEVVIVLPHWGTKNLTDVHTDTRQMAAALALSGADVILGTHPNVPQETETIRTTRADGLSYETLVCYSLGCLLTDARAEENTAGMVAEISLTYDPQARRVTACEMDCVPIYIAQQKENGMNVYRAVCTRDEEALLGLTDAERENAARAAALVCRITGAGEIDP